MNPVSLKGRDLVPLESRPAELLDFKIAFFGPEGMASALPSPGDSFHGVVHLMKDADMDVLDALEVSYDKIIGT